MNLDGYDMDFGKIRSFLIIEEKYRCCAGVAGIHHLESSKIPLDLVGFNHPGPSES